MFQGHEQNTSNFPGHFELPRGDVAVDFKQALTDPRLEIEDSRESWPILFALRDFGMRLFSSVQKFAAQNASVKLSHDIGSDHRHWGRYLSRR
jgi:hypothetical protein